MIIDKSALRRESSLGEISGVGELGVGAENMAHVGIPTAKPLQPFYLPYAILTVSRVVLSLRAAARATLPGRLSPPTRRTISRDWFPAMSRS